MTSAMAAAVAVDLATAAATIAATFRARGNNNSSPAAQFLPGPVGDAVADHHHLGGSIVGDSRATMGAVSLRTPQLRVPALSTSQGPAAEEQRHRQLAHRHGVPFDSSAPAMPMQQQQQQQQQQQGQPRAQGSVAVVPDWARGLPPEVQAELLRAIATAHLTNAQ